MRILVLCTANSCRSQMAHGYLQDFAGRRAEILSAGVRTDGVNPRAIAVMKEDGIDISHHTSNHLDEYRDVKLDHVITVCDNAREACPWFPADAQHHHHSFEDPALVQGANDAAADTSETVDGDLLRHGSELLLGGRKVVRSTPPSNPRPRHSSGFFRRKDCSVAQMPRVDRVAFG
jgi:arsenate reductase